MKWPNMFLAWLIPDIPCMAVGVARIVSMIVWASCAIGSDDVVVVVDDCPGISQVSHALDGGGIGSDDIKSCSFRWVSGLPQKFIGSKEEWFWKDWVALAGICCIYVIMLGM